MKTVDIERLVAWAWREELPKLAPASDGLSVLGFGRAWGGLERYGELLTVVDMPTNRYTVADPTATTAPHPDAIMIGDAVQSLDRLVLDVPPDWDPIDGLGDLTAAERGAAVQRAMARIAAPVPDGERRFRVSPWRLVERHAVLGGAPDWRAEVPERQVVRGANGKPRWFRSSLVWAGALDADGLPVPGLGGYVEVETEGRNARTHEPYPDAYRKTVLDPDPAEAVVARAEYEIWRSALDLLVEDLAGRLADHVATASARPYRPWLDGEAAAARVLWPVGAAAGAAAWTFPPKRPALASARSGRRARRGGAACETGA